MNSHAVEDGGVQRLHIADDLTVYTATAIKSLMQAALAAPGALELDLTGVAAIDTAGLQLLLAAQRSATAQGRQLGLGAPSEAVRDSLALCALDRCFASQANDERQS